jgi:hypothetical protein
LRCNVYQSRELLSVSLASGATRHTRQPRCLPPGFFLQPHLVSALLVVSPPHSVSGLPALFFFSHTLCLPLRGVVSTTLRRNLNIATVTASTFSRMLRPHTVFPEQSIMLPAHITQSTGIDGRVYTANVLFGLHILCRTNLGLAHSYRPALQKLCRPLLMLWCLRPTQALLHSLAIFSLCVTHATGTLAFYRMSLAAPFA